MKRIILIAAVIIAAVFVLFPQNVFIRESDAPKETQTQEAPSVSVVIDNGTTASTTSGISAQNAFQALEYAAQQQNIELTTKQYDFGVFVERIGALANTKEKSWIYSVNGKPGTVAADKQQVSTGDSIEWKYMTPTIE